MVNHVKQSNFPAARQVCLSKEYRKILTPSNKGKRVPTSRKCKGNERSNPAWNRFFLRGRYKKLLHRDLPLVSTNKTMGFNIDPCTSDYRNLVFSTPRIGFVKVFLTKPLHDKFSATSPYKKPYGATLNASNFFVFESQVVMQVSTICRIFWRKRFWHLENRTNKLETSKLRKPTRSTLFTASCRLNSR